MTTTLSCLFSKKVLRLEDSFHLSIGLPADSEHGRQFFQPTWLNLRSTQNFPGSSALAAKAARGGFCGPQSQVWQLCMSAQMTGTSSNGPVMKVTRYAAARAKGRKCNSLARKSLGCLEMLKTPLQSPIGDDHHAFLLVQQKGFKT